MFGCAEAMQMALNNKFTFECQFWKHLLKGINLNVCFLSRVSLLKFFSGGILHLNFFFLKSLGARAQLFFF